eukprot:TRINITY_DN17035_c0_g1_i3.p1 TRINITY_DN17035_c0_g1~~TRINITY_DN17035_c0_g1_i3.p1  ORF type:complete len:236 (+),score=29.27 TRINITY_DN17035_c0_g1_i3:164-871(+)
MENEIRTMTDQGQLTKRLTSYPLINLLFNTYGSVKESSNLLKCGFETAESLTGTVISTLDSTLGVNLERRGNQVLDQIEGRAYNAKERARKQVNQLLDFTANVVDRLLPPMDFEQVDLESEKEEDNEILPRVIYLTYTIPRRFRAVAIDKLSSIDLKNTYKREEHDMVEYLRVVKDDTYHTFGKLMELIQKHRSIRNIPSLESFTKRVVNWSDSINRELSDVMEDIVKDPTSILG